MARINLLPWREEYRQEKKKEFQVQLFALSLLAVIVCYSWVGVVNGKIENQGERNNILQTEIKALDKKVAEIKELKKKREDLIARMKVIQDLQGTRPTIVRYFDEMVRSVPDGIFFNSITRKGDQITIIGITESSNRVSTFMRNLDSSEWFSNPNLRSIKANTAYGDQAAEFHLQLKTALPVDQKPEGGA